MSQLYVDNIRNRTGGPIGIPTGAVVTGVVTATTGNITGNLTVGGNADVTGVLTYEDVTNVDSVGVVTARSGIEFGASGVGGTVTGVGNAEFVGIITAKSGLRATSAVVGGGVTVTGVGELVVSQSTVGQSATLFLGKGGNSKTFAVSDAGQVKIGSNLDSAGTTNITLNADGSADFAGDISIADKIIHTGDTNTAIRFPAADTFTVETAGSERFRIHSTGISHFKAGLAEKVNVKSQLTSANACAITDGNVILTTSAEPGNTYPDITGVHSVLSSGEGFSVTIALKVDGSGTINGFRIDGVAQTIEWSGGSAPSAGSDGYDVFTFSAFKTGSGTTDYKVFGAATNYT